MGFLLLILFIAILANKMGASADKAVAQPDQVTIVKKQCPPHQWFWQEIKDQHGELQGQRIVCKVCGPLSKSLEGSVE